MSISEFSIKPIAEIRTGFSSKFGIPRQSGIVSELCGRIIFKKEYSGPDWTRGIEGFSHIWVLWIFSENINEKIGATVRPPKLGGNTKMGVFATRSPFRPNFIGMSVLELVKKEYTKEFGTVLYVKGADLLDGTPIIDIKPYLSVSDRIDGTLSGFTAEGSAKTAKTLEVEIDDKIFGIFPEQHIPELYGILSQDPRPAYISDGDRVFSFEFYGFNIKFTVNDGVLNVVAITNLTEKNFC